MAVNDVKGVNFSTEDNGRLFMFFDDAWGMAFRHLWEINCAIVHPNSIKPSIKKLIDDVVAAGNDEQIAMLIVNPDQAVRLCLESVIRIKHLRKATEKGRESIDIPGVEVAERTLTIRVMKNVTLAVADRSGRTL